MTARWSDQDSAALDRENLRMRRVPYFNPSANTGEGTTQSYTDRSAPRGVLKSEEVERRRKVERAMRRRQGKAAAQAPRRRPWPLPEPKLKPSGRWLARVTHKGRVYERTFDTQSEAQQYIREVVEE